MELISHQKIPWASLVLWPFFVSSPPSKRRNTKEDSIKLCRWKNSAGDLKESGKQVLEAIQKASERTVEQVTEDEVRTRLDHALQSAHSHFERSYDSQFGGFGGPPKFSTAPNLRFLLRQKDETLQMMVLSTLEKIAQGGIRDHIEGGFHRYSVDRQWHLPQ